jgi:small subunit ribosomal protein S1
MESGVLEIKEQSEAINPKMKYNGKVIKISLAGAVVDISTPQPAVLHISQIPSPSEAEPIKRVEDVLQIGQEIEVWVKRVREDHIELTMFKPLDLEWREIKKGMVVKGKVVRMEKFGAFIEIGAERPGLVHISEMSHGYVRMPSDVVKEGDEVEAEVLDVNRKKKQIKLSMKAVQPEPVAEEEEDKSFDMVPPKDKRPRRGKPGRKGGHKDGEDSDHAENYQESANESEPDPTAMEIAIRDAMERAKKQKRLSNQAAKKAKTYSKEHEDILARTLENKISS